MRTYTRDILVSAWEVDGDSTTGIDWRARGCTHSLCDHVLCTRVVFAGGILQLPKKSRLMGQHK